MQYFVSYFRCLGPIQYNAKYIHFVKLYCSKITQGFFLTQTSLSDDIRQFDRLTSVATQNHSSLPKRAVLFFFFSATSLPMPFHLLRIHYILIDEYVKIQLSLNRPLRIARTPVWRIILCSVYSHGPVGIFITAVVTLHCSWLLYLYLQMECEFLEGRKMFYSFYFCIPSI